MQARSQPAAKLQAPEQQQQQQQPTESVSLVPDSDTEDDIPLAQRICSSPPGSKEQASQAVAAGSEVQTIRDRSQKRSSAGTDVPTAVKRPRWPTTVMDAAQLEDEDAAEQGGGVQQMQHLNAHGFWTLISSDSVAARRKRKQARPTKAEFSKRLPGMPRSERQARLELLRALLHIRSSAVSLRPLQPRHLAQLPRCWELDIFLSDVPGARRQEHAAKACMLQCHFLWCVQVWPAGRENGVLSLRRLTV